MENVRRIGRFTDIDGLEVQVGVDHDAMTITAGRTVIRLDRGHRQNFHALWVAATVAIDEYVTSHPEREA
jgi:hypothetical protein